MKTKAKHPAERLPLYDECNECGEPVWPEEDKSLEPGFHKDCFAIHMTQCRIREEEHNEPLDDDGDLSADY